LVRIVEVARVASEGGETPERRATGSGQPQLDLMDG